MDYPRAAYALRVSALARRSEDILHTVVGGGRGKTREPTPTPSPSLDSESDGGSEYETQQQRDMERNDLRERRSVDYAKEVAELGEGGEEEERIATPTPS